MNRPWKRICCAVDLSEPSRVALDQAVGAAKRLGAELTLVHVFVPPPPAASDVLVSSRELARTEEREAQEALARWRDDAARDAGIPVRAVVLSGDPPAEIARWAREQACDVIVVGTHGRSGFRRLVLGSVAERVVRHAPCSVLVAREAGEPRD